MSDVKAIDSNVEPHPGLFSSATLLGRSFCFYLKGRRFVIGRSGC